MRRFRPSLVAGALALALAAAESDGHAHGGGGGGVHVFAADRALFVHGFVSLSAGGAEEGSEEGGDEFFHR